jgi:hypothetical protein
MRWVVMGALLAGCSGCDGGGTVCGQDGGAGGVSATIEAETIEYGNFTSSANNDCSVEGSPTSLTIDGEQTVPAQPSFALTLCLPRPDRIGGDPVALVASQIPPGAGDLVQVINVNAELAGDCILQLDGSGSFDATATFAGYCGDGLDPAGFSLALAGTLPGTRICPGPVTEPVTIELSGGAPVSAR